MLCYYYLEYFVALVDVEVFRRKRMNVVNVISHKVKVFSKTSLPVILEFTPRLADKQKKTE